MMKTRQILTIMFSLFISTATFSQLNINAHVATFSTSSLSYSDYYYRQVTIVTGVILKLRTNNQNFDGTADYVIISFSQDEVAIIKLREDLFDFGQRLNFATMSESSFKLLLAYKNKTWDGYDQDNTKWRICFGNEYEKYSCDTKTDPLYYLIDGSKKLSTLIDDYNRIINILKSGNISNCQYYKSQLTNIETIAKELKDRFPYGSFMGKDPYWDSFLEFLGDCTEVQSISSEIARDLCKQ